MDKILSAIKCDICKSILKTPVLLPCSHSVCAVHITESIQPSICCGECRAEHEITDHHSFPLNQALARIIEAEIEALDFGNAHRDAKNSCDRLSDVLGQVEHLLKDPNHFTHQRIDELKNMVELKGEQLKLKIDDEVSRLLAKLNRYENDCKLLLATSEYSSQAGKLHNKLKDSQRELDLSTSYLNKIKFDEPKWNDIKTQSENEIQNIMDRILEFKKDLLLNKFNIFDDEIKMFNQISIDRILEYSIIQIDSKILDNNRLKIALSDLLEFSIKSEWTLIYRGSEDGFAADSFHSQCNENSRTLTLIKTTNSYIFGGYTEAEWASSDLRSDKNAFLFSLVNKDKSPIKMNINKNDDRAIYCMASFGPIFGSGHDICISDGCNLNSDSYSKLGGSFVHPDYLNDAEQAKCFLAGESNFKVAEIEVFQKIN